MSMISEQVKHLRELSDTAKMNVYSFEALSRSLRQAADTIEDLSAKPAAVNMERYCGEENKLIEEMAEEIENCYGRETELSERAREYLLRTDYGGGWIVASERMPEEERCIDPETGYYGRSDYVLCSAYDDYEMKDEIWIDYTIDGEWQTHEWYEGEN